MLCFSLLHAGRASADTVILRAEQDLTVSELHPQRAEFAGTEHILSAGIGFTNRAGRIQGYMRFALTEIPTSTWMHQTSIDSAVLHLFVLAHSLTFDDERYKGKLYLMNISSCDDATWREEELTWESRTCADDAVSQDAKIIDGELLPSQQTFDVTEAFDRALARGDGGVTVIADSQRLLQCSRDPLEGIGCPDFEQRGFLNVASRERQDFRVSVVPRVVVSYSQRPTSMMTYVNSTLAVLSALAMLLGLYGGVRSLRRRAR